MTRAGDLARRVAPWLVAAFVIWATLARQTGIPKLQTIWAEDGAVFAQCAYFDPQPLACLIDPYAGYFHTVPRIGALIATLPAPSSLGTSLGIVAAVFAGYVALAVARSVIALTGSLLAGVFTATTLVLVYQAGREVGGNLANLHWILLAGGIVILVTGWLGRDLDGIDLSVLAAAGLSSAFVPVLFALALVLVAVRRPRPWVPLIVVALCSAVQVVTSILSPRPSPPAESIGLQGYLRAYVIDVVGRGPFGGLRLPPDWLVTAGFVAVVVVLVAVRLRSRGWSSDDAARTAPIRPLAVVAVMLTLAGIGVAVFVISTWLNHVANPRYAYLPTVMTTVALILGATLLPPTVRRTDDAGASPARPARASRMTASSLAAVVLPAICVVLAVGYARSFLVDARASNGPDFEVGYQGARATCAAPAAERAAVRIAPYPATDDWFVEIPCSRVR